MELLISLIITVVVILFLLWLVGQLPFDAAAQRIVRVVIIVFAILWCLQLLYHPVATLWYPRY